MIGVGATKFWVGEKKVGMKSQKGRPDLPDFHLIGWVRGITDLFLIPRISNSVHF
jgi:hypothetical protein